MQSLFIASECSPLVKSGGLGDVTGALARALTALGNPVRIIIPLYKQVDREQLGFKPTGIRLESNVGTMRFQTPLWQAVLPGSDVIVYGVEQSALFEREGLYQSHGTDEPDNLLRFSVFCQAALRALPLLRWRPDVIQCHDWQAALASCHLALGVVAREPFYRNMRTVLTVHNLAYQGVFPYEQWPWAQLPDSAFGLQGLEFYGRINCLKGGLLHADWLTTVSPTYAKEIQTQEEGCGLDGILRMRASRLTGILNGIDVEEWDPSTDPLIEATYSQTRLAGKQRCRRALLAEQKLPDDEQLLIGMVQRLVEQKGFEIFLEALEALMEMPLRIIVLGTGDAMYHRELEAAARRYPGRIAVNLFFDNALAHRIEAGADAFLMPSRFEPCGLNQMYSMRYGTVPIVRRVGGLADTVTDLSPRTLKAQTATGFAFDEYAGEALAAAVRRAVDVFEDKKVWTQLMRNGMRLDFSWERSAGEYLQIYERAR